MDDNCLDSQDLICSVLLPQIGQEVIDLLPEVSARVFVPIAPDLALEIEIVSIYDDEREQITNQDSYH